MSNEEELVENVTVGEPYGSNDHCVIKWDMVKKIRNKNYNRDHFNVDYAQLREDAQKINWSEIRKGCNVEDDWIAFTKVIIDIRDKYIPKKSYKISFKAKLVTKEVTKCRRLKNKAWKRYVKLKTIES